MQAHIFQGAGVKTEVLFFEKDSLTRRIGGYPLDLGRSLGKTNPLNGIDLAEFVKPRATKADSPKCGSVDFSTLSGAEGYATSR